MQHSDQAPLLSCFLKSTYSTQAKIHSCTIMRQPPIFLPAFPADNFYAHPLDTVVFYDFNTDTIKEFVCYGRKEGQQVCVCVCACMGMCMP